MWDMPKFGKLSKSRLFTCDRDLILVFDIVIQTFDCSILCGHRNKDDQGKAFLEGVSKVKWPKSKHNSIPSKAVDAAPYPLNWKDEERIVYFAGFVMGVANGLGVELKWGGDWNKNWKTEDEKFRDLCHFELEE